MAADRPDPTSGQEVREREQEYQERVDAWNDMHESSLGSVLLPPADAGPLAARMYHELMHDWGWGGIEYAQEALHQNGEYFRDYFETVDQCREDVQRMFEVDPDAEAPYPVSALPDRCQHCGERGVEVELCDDCAEDRDD